MRVHHSLRNPSMAHVNWSYSLILKGFMDSGVEKYTVFLVSIRLFSPKITLLLLRVVDMHHLGGCSGVDMSHIRVLK